MTPRILFSVTVNGYQPIRTEAFLIDNPARQNFITYFLLAPVNRK